MLQSLHIHNFALIEDLHLTFGDGVTAKPAPANRFFSTPSVCWQANAHRHRSSVTGRTHSSSKARSFFLPCQKGWNSC